MKACTTELLLVSDKLLLNCDMQTRERFFFKIPTTNGFANGSNCTTTRTKAIGGGGGGVMSTRASVDKGQACGPKVC